MTILEALQWGEQELKSTAHEKVVQEHNAKLDAQVLLSFCLKKPKSFLFAHMDEQVPAEKLHRYKTFIIRRKQHEPVAYITGVKEFYGREFTVTTSTLIPRPETEQFIEFAKHHYKQNDNIVEIGTGSGAISITTALELGTTVFASDISVEALQVARKNSEKLDAAHLVSFHQGDLLAPYIQHLHEHPNEKNGKTILLANLPYITLRNWESIDPDVKNFEPKTALVSGVDGLDHYDRLLQQIHTYKHLLTANILLFFEMDPSQDLTLPALISDHFPGSVIHIHDDLRGKARMVEASIQLQ